MEDFDKILDLYFSSGLENVMSIEEFEERLKKDDRNCQCN